MESALRERLRLTLSIALSLLPRWTKHDFAQRSQPRQGRAQESIVEALIEAVDGEFDVADKSERPEYRGWGP